MTDLPEQRIRVGTRGETRDGKMDAIILVAPALSRDERIWLWMLRLVLPIILGLCGQLIFWMWFNNVYGLNAWSVVGGVLLGGVAVLVALWAWHSWLPFEPAVPLMATENRFRVRNFVLAMLAFVAVAGFIGLNYSSDPPKDGVQLARAA
jgi:hypothetical protein